MSGLMKSACIDHHPPGSAVNILQAVSEQLLKTCIDWQTAILQVLRLPGGAGHLCDRERVLGCSEPGHPAGGGRGASLL
jgi:hypothetical protein